MTDISSSAPRPSGQSGPHARRESPPAHRPGALAGAFERVHVELIDASWHVDTEAICPDCLRSIRAADYVRRNAFDLLEHETCPPLSLRSRT